MSPCARSTPTHQLLEELISKIPTLPKFHQEGNFREVGGSELTIQSEQFFAMFE
jgi:hypothetical protein